MEQRTYEMVALLRQQTCDVCVVPLVQRSAHRERSVKVVNCDDIISTMEGQLVLLPTK